MRAVVIDEYGGPEKLNVKQVPDPVPGPGELQIRVSAASINPIDNKLRSGVMKAMMPLHFPAILGFDFSGTVQTVGEGTNGFAIGDRVFGRAQATFAELVIAKPEEILKVPAGLDPIHAAALPVVVLTGDQAIRSKAALQPGQTVFIAGALGSVGRTAVFVAKEAGLKVLVGVRQRQRDQAEELGADQIVPMDAAEALKHLPQLDAVADFVGHTIGEQLLGKVKEGGVFVTAVGPPANAKDYPQVRVEMMQVVSDNARLDHLAKAVISGALVIPIDRIIPLEQAAEGVAAVEAGGIGKVLLLA